MPTIRLFGSSKLTAQTAVMAMAAGLLGTGVILGLASPASAAACSSSASGYAGGDGSSGNPYQISNAAELIRLSGTTADWTNKFFIQTADIDLNSCEWSPIGPDGGSFFSGGAYDGGLFKIEGLKINDSSGAGSPYGVGLFGYASGTTIRNLTVAGEISSNSDHVGGLLGYGVATITSVRSEVDIAYTEKAGGGVLGRAGGLVGELLLGGTISYSSYKGDVRSSIQDVSGGLVGGFVGSMSNSYVVQTDAVVDISFTARRAGGLFAQVYSSNASKSYAVSSLSEYGITYGLSGNTMADVFWSTSIGPANPRFSGTITGATGKSTSELTTLNTFSNAGWDIVNGWDTFNPGASKVWGICSLVNNGYPFLLWEYSTNPCVAPSSGSSGSAMAPPSSAVAEMSISGSGLKKSPLLRVRLTKIPAAFEQLVLVVGLTDFQDVLLQELRVPIPATATFVDVPIDRPIGQFNVVARTSNAGSSTAAVSLNPQTVKQSALRQVVQGKPIRLLGSQLGKDVLFREGSAALSPKAKKNLRQAARLARASDSRVAVTGIAGAASNSGKTEKRLAEKRALRVANYLSRKGLTNWIYYFGLSSAKSAELKGQPQRVELRILR